MEISEIVGCYMMATIQGSDRLVVVSFLLVYKWFTSRAETITSVKTPDPYVKFTIICEAASESIVEGTNLGGTRLGASRL